MHGQNAVLNRFSPWGQDYGPSLPSLESLSSSSHYYTPNSLSIDRSEFPVNRQRSLPSSRTSCSLSSKMQAMSTDEEYANLQKLSNEFQPHVEGPLVGTRQSSRAISSEYADADDVYVQKTAALPSKYSHYRTIRGDGNCGWRAIAFSYFEILQQIGDKDRIHQEMTRLRSLNNLLNTVGFQEHLYEDFVEETITLLRTLAESVSASADDTNLLEKFNDSEISNAIITHFRLLTSAWMKTHADAYQDFMEGVSVDQYCSYSIEPYQVEIENVGITALTDILLKPIGLSLEVLYLDRSVGHEVNSHRFEAVDLDGNPLYPNAETMRLLYRPGHYDILYKLGDVQRAMPQVQVAMLPSYSNFQMPQQVPMASESSNDGIAPYLTAIPGMSFASVPSNNMTPLGLSPSNGIMSSGYAGGSPVTPVSPGFPSPSLPLSPSVTEKGAGGFRPSKYEYEADFFPSPMTNMPFQTPTFRNSHFNPAHFRNQDFQPEMWCPESEPAKSPKDENGHPIG